MAAEQPDWLKLHLDLLEPIAQGSRDAVAGFAAFRSVCQTWRSAVTPAAAPRLLLPRKGTTPSNKYDFVFPLSRGWFIVVDACDVSCHLKHLSTGATAVLPKLNTVRDSFTSEITHVGYEHEEAPSPNALSGDGGHRGYKFKINYGWYYNILETDLDFSDVFKFAIHIPPGTAAASTDGMVIMMYHALQGNTGMVFCRPGDTAWTKIANPSLECDPPVLECSSFTDFAYFEGKMLAVDHKGITLVFDATTLQLLYQVPATPNVSSKILQYAHDDIHCVRLVALPSKVLLVEIRVSSSKLESLDIFELAKNDDGEQAWRKVTGNDVGGSYELFLDCYHSTFRDARDDRGTRIYFHHDFSDPVGSAAAYCYNMQDDKLECVYVPSKDDDKGFIYSTRASWFVPTN
ncbi:unnamed protein product [Alopecurus aequalis]